MREELQALESKATWSLVQQPKGRSLISTRWVYQIKHRPDGAIDRFKARLVARGFSQRPGVDYEETYAPTVMMSSLRLLLAIAASRKWHMHQAHVSNAYLNGVLNEEIYLAPPEGLDTGGSVLRLHKGLYGLKQSGRVWSEALCNHMRTIGFRRTRSDPCVFVRGLAGGASPDRTYIAVYVDDFAILGASLNDVNAAKRDIARAFALKDLGPATAFLGFDIRYDRQQSSMLLSQQRIADTVLNRYGMADSRPVDTPIEPSTSLSSA